MWIAGTNGHVDMFVSAIEPITTALVNRLGFSPPAEFGYQPGPLNEGVIQPGDATRLPNYGLEISMVRLGQGSPSYVQIIALVTLSTEERRRASETPLNSIYGTLTAIMRQQGNRPIKSHTILPELVGGDAGSVLAHMKQNGVPFLLTDATEPVPFPTLTPGMHGDPLAYDLSVTGGLPFEWGGWDIVGQPHRDPKPVADPRLSPTADRFVSRSYLVESIDGCLDALARNLNFIAEPGDVVRQRFEGHESATLLPRNREDVALEIIQPTSESGPAGQYFEAYGVGPYAYRIGVTDLGKKLDDFNRRGTSWAEISDAPCRRILVNPNQVCGALIEYEERGEP